MSKYLPSLSLLVTVDNLPEELSFIEDGLNSVFSKLYFKDFYSQKSFHTKEAFYSLTIVSYTRLGFDIGGEDGFALVLNPGYEDGNTTEFPISFSYSWPILKYLDNFSIQDFDFSVASIYTLLLEAFDVEELTLFEQVIEVFYPDFSGYEYDEDEDEYEEEDPYQNFINDFNQKNNPPTPLVNIALEDTTSILEDLISQLSSNGNDYTIVDVVLNDYLTEDDDFGTVNTKIERLFLAIVGYFEIDNFIDFLIPRFNVSIDDLNLALEFPRTWLKPVNDQNVVIDDIKSKLTYNVGSLNYNSVYGFEFLQADSFDLDRSQIGNTGLIIAFNELKFDFRTDRNIPEAISDDRPDNFRGVYAEEASITLPSKWFKEVDNTTLSIVGNDMLIGTGGISGTIALQATDGTPNNGNDYLDTNLGGWTVGFNHFDINFKQNVITESNIVGKLVIPKLKDSDGNVADIEITGHLNEKGDFNLTAYEKDGFKEFNVFNFVNFNILSLELGSEDDKFYIGTSCEIWFDNAIMQKIFDNRRIIIPRFRIYEDGSMEIIGGNGFIPVNIPINLGPVDISITGIHFGSTQQEFNGEMRKYSYWGFDGAISINPLGIDARGEGIKYYYTIDNDEFGDDGDSFLRIQTIEVDLVIPGNADPSSAMAIINGMVSIPEPGESQEYEGKVGLKLPKLRIAGGAHMSFKPREAAFIVQAEVGVPSPIPLAATGLAFYSFGGILGYKYVAEKEAIKGFTSENTWYEYYKYPERGVNNKKFSSPPDTNDYSVPVTIGAGTVLGTIFDDGYTFSTSVMAILSLPSVFILDGRANILSERLSLLDTTEPPFFAFVAIGDGSFEFAIGADYSLPSNGWILDIYAEIEAGFFSNNPSGWYLNFGTRDKPIRAEVLTIVTAQTYLMLSARGMEMGARADFNIKMNFFGIRVRIEAYFEVGAKISFERLQLGGYVALGGLISVSVWRIVGFTVKLEAILGAEAVNPFLLYAQLKLRICIRIIFKICVTVKVQLRWEKSKTVVIDGIPALPNDQSAYIDRTEESVKGVHMLTGEVFDLEYSESIPTANTIDAIIPLDTFIDIKTMKGLDPSEVREMIGGHTGMATNFIDLVPPNKTVKGGRVLRQVKHKYAIEKVELKMHNGSNWVDYHPFEAVVPENDRDRIKDLGLPIGYWQRNGQQYDAIRILGTSPFSYMSSGEPGWFIPEQYGVTPSELFCVSEGLQEDCVNFLNKQINAKYFKPNGYEAHYINGAYFTLGDENELTSFNFEVTQDLTTGETAIEDSTSQSSFQITDQVNNFGFDRSLQFSNSESLIILLPTSSKEVTLKLTTFASGVTITYFKTTINTSVVNNEYVEVASVFKTKDQLEFPVEYTSETDFLDKVTITPLLPNNTRISEIREEIAQLFEESYDGAAGSVTVLLPENQESYNELVAEYEALVSESCSIVNVNDLNLNQDQKVVLCEIYNEIDDDGIDEYRFRIYNDSCEIVLSSSTRYTSEASAIEEANTTLYNIQNNSESFDIKQSTNGKHYFNIVDDTNEIIARRIEYFSSLSECEKEIQFIKELLQKSTLEFINESCIASKGSETKKAVKSTQTSKITNSKEVKELIYEAVFSGLIDGDTSFDITLPSGVEKIWIEIILTLYKDVEQSTGLSPLFSIINQNGTTVFSNPIEGGYYENQREVEIEEEITLPNGTTHLTFLITEMTTSSEFLAVFKSANIYAVKQEVTETPLNKYFINKYNKEKNHDYFDSIKNENSIYTVGRIFNDGTNGLITKLDSLGNVIWEKIYKSLDDHNLEFYKIINCDNSDVLILGSDNYSSDTDKRISLTRVDANGNLLWRKYYVTTDGISGITNLVKLNDGSFVLQVQDSYSANSWGVFILKINDDGSIITQKKLSSNYWGAFSVNSLKGVATNGENVVIVGPHLDIVELDSNLNLKTTLQYDSFAKFDSIEYLGDQLIVTGSGYQTVVTEDTKSFFATLNLENIQNGDTVNLDLTTFGVSVSSFFNVGNDKIYSNVVSGSKSLIHCFSKDFEPLYSKSYDLNTIIYFSQIDEKGVLFTDDDGHVGFVGEDFESCQTSETGKVLVAEKAVITGEFNDQVTIEESDVSSIDIATEVSDVESVKEEICVFDDPIVAEEEETITICNTTLQEVCWLSQEKWEYNQTIPGQDAMEEEQENMVAAVESTVQPIWRPNTKYYLHFALKDEINNGEYEDTFNYYYSFKTVGPLGHYHKHTEVTYLPENANPDNYPITSLRQYIDYNKSYPNANGSLLQAKPLFYGATQAKIALFFVESLTQHMFKTWDGYNGLDEIKGNIHLAIKDPVTDVIIPYPLPTDFNTETIPSPEGNGEGGVPWVGDDDPRLPLNIRTINNWINYINENPLGPNIIKCDLQIGNAIKPLSYSYSVTLTNLKPSKLYTVLVYNAFDANDNDNLINERVHEYVFQTSRYSNFKEQVNSYQLSDEEGNTRQAIFTVETPLTATEIEEAYTIVTAQNLNELSFDNLTEKIVGLKPLDPPVTTEFNILKNANSEDVIGMLIRNPEPFNNPKIPIETAKGMISIKDDINEDYKILYSKDYANAIIMHTSKKIIVDTLDFIFQYYVWDGKEYNVEDVEVNGITIKNN